ncbi:hypothetical protein KKC1_34540 [Calderihabitans maritimus]|uniref:Uncharacterized protein n=1 Tax=Calderihabitans maritimus TaxID=1246530 RepID=A0A1Z5HXU6_9FIRM|nr:hypothetical protein KKC1_34540 [Calderihabitans maritimus]
MLFPGNRLPSRREEVVCLSGEGFSLEYANEYSMQTIITGGMNGVQETSLAACIGNPGCLYA